MSAFTADYSPGPMIAGESGPAPALVPAIEGKGPVMSDMRYARVEDVIRLAISLQGTAEGLTLDEIAYDYGVSRKTAERMRDTLLRVFPQVEELGEAGGRKRWRLPSRSLGRFAEPTLAELAALCRASALAEREGDAELSELLSDLGEKLRAGLAAEARRRFAPDLETLMEADGVARRPGPREYVSPEVLEKLRAAILGGVWIDIDHRARATGKLRKNTKVGPLALLLGEGRQYLVAWREKAQAPRLFALTGIEKVRARNEVFLRPVSFDLDAYLDRGFGVFQEEQHDVVWRFSPEAATDARKFRFHRSQAFEPQDDGSLIVRFRAGGLREMAWHLFRWGDAVEVLEPEALRAEYKAQLARAQTALGAPPDP